MHIIVEKRFLKVCSKLLNDVDEINCSQHNNSDWEDQKCQWDYMALQVLILMGHFQNERAIYLFIIIKDQPLNNF